MHGKILLCVFIFGLNWSLNILRNNMEMIDSDDENWQEAIMFLKWKSDYKDGIFSKIISFIFNAPTYFKADIAKFTRAYGLTIKHQSSFSENVTKYENEDFKNMATIRLKELDSHQNNHFLRKTITIPLEENKIGNIRIDRIEIRDKNVVLRNQSFNVTIDRELLEIYGDKNTIDKINRIIGVEKKSDCTYVIDCRKISSLPIISFSIDNNLVKLNPNDYIIQDSVRSSKCYSGFRTDKKLNTWIFGKLFTNTVYMAYDFTNKIVRISLINK